MGRYSTVTHDRDRGFVHIHYAVAVIATEADVATFADEIDRAMRGISKPIDILIDLGELTVKPAAAAAYDRERQRMLAAYGNRVLRYGGTSLVRTRILTSSAIHGQDANLFETYEEALDALLNARAARIVRRDFRA